MCDPELKAWGGSKWKLKSAIACPNQCTNHRIMENSCWKGPQQVSSPASCSKQGRLWGQTGLFRAVSSWGLKRFQDGNGLTLPGSLLQCLPVLMGTKILLVSSLNISFFQFMLIVSHLPTRHSSKEPGSIPLMTSSWTLGTAAEPAQLPQPLLTGLPPWASWWPSIELIPVDWCLPCDVVPSKDDCSLILILLQFMY